MVLFDFDAKDEFSDSTQLQNYGRLLARSTREAHEIIKEVVLRSAKEPKPPVEENFPTDKNKNEAEQFTHDFDSARTRQVLWQRVRGVREVLLKSLVLLSLKKSLPVINDAVQVGVRVWDARELIRRQAQDFYQIQWPPNGSFPPPIPPPAVQVATNVLTSGDPMTLPQYSKLVVEQFASHDIADTVKHMHLPHSTRRRIEKKLSRAILSDYALAVSERKYHRQDELRFVNFKLREGRVHLSCPGEFTVTFVSDFRKYQFERVRLMIGEQIGYTCTHAMEIMATNTLQSGCNIVVDTLRTLARRATYEVNSWKALINASKEVREKARAARALFNWLIQENMIDEGLSLPEELMGTLLDADPYRELVDGGTSPQENVSAVANALSVAESVPDGAASPERDVGDAVSSDASMEEPSERKTSSDKKFGELQDRLYLVLLRLEKECAHRLGSEREKYRSLDDQSFTLEFYRYIVRIVSRMSRYISFLLIRDQARLISECQLPPAGLFYVDEWTESSCDVGGPQADHTTGLDLRLSPSPQSPSRLTEVDELIGNPETRSEGGETEATTYYGGKRNKPGWKVLFENFYHDPPGSPGLQTDSYPFARLFDTGGLPLNVDHLDLDILPALPVALFDRWFRPTRGENDPAHKKRRLSTNGLPAVSRLSFMFSHNQSELSVSLWPLRGLIDEWASSPLDGTRSWESKVLAQLVEKLSTMESFKSFYHREGETLMKASSSLVRKFAPHALNLSAWLTKAHRVLAAAALRVLSAHLSVADELASDWQFPIVEAANDDWATLLHIQWGNSTVFTIWVDFMTGALSLNPSRFGDWLHQLRIQPEEAGNYVSHLSSHLSSGELPRIVRCLAALEQFLQRQRQDEHVQCEEITIVSEED